MAIVSASPFFQSRAERLQLARRRYFEDGVTPVGVVTEAIFESWARCQRLHNEPSREVVFQPVTNSRTHHALQKNHQLNLAWQAELPGLEAILGATSCAAMLTDATGVLIGASCAGRAHEHLMPVATRLGVDLSEEAVGTTAPGVVARTGQPVSVIGGEHFFDEVRDMQCAAAPIRDCSGKLAGVLDISSELLPFTFDASSLVSIFASAIENRLLLNQSMDHLVVRIQIAAPLLDTAMVGLFGVDHVGGIAWSNGIAAKLLGLRTRDTQISMPKAEEVLNISLAQLMSISRTQAASVRLRNGLLVWIRCDRRAADGHQNLFPSSPTVEPTVSSSNALEIDSSESASPEEDALVEPLPDARCETTDEATTLRQADREIVRRAVQECGGNISHAAKMLGVSRGLIYRRLKGDA